MGGAVRVWGVAGVLGLLASLQPCPVPEVEVLLAEAIGTARAWSYRTEQVDWPQLEARVRRVAVGARDAADLLPAYVVLLHGLGDRHSFVEVPPERRAAVRERLRGVFRPEDRPPTPTSPFVSRSEPAARTLALGRAARAELLVVPRFSGDEWRGGPYARAVYGFIAAAAERSCGYVVDLRGNLGGNLWPMLLGVGALLGDGPVGSMSDRKGLRRESRFEEGVLRSERGGMRMWLDTWRSRPWLAEAPVAVLIDDAVASSGEGVAVAFRSRPNTRFFGRKTYGVATANSAARLSDGTRLFITVGVMLDREGRSYPDGVLPDVVVEAGEGAPHDPDDADVEAAKAWLAAQPACRTPAGATPARLTRRGAGQG